MGRLASVITRDGSKISTQEQFEELVSSLRAEQQKQALSQDRVQELDDEALGALIEQLGKEKK